MARRRSSMNSRRNSLLSMSLFDVPLFGTGGGMGSNRNSLGLGSMMGFHDSDPFAPLSITDVPLPLTGTANSYQQRPNNTPNDSSLGLNMVRNGATNQHTSTNPTTTIDRLLGDRSESSGSTAPTIVTASSYGSMGNSINGAAFLSQQSALHQQQLQQLNSFGNNMNQLQQLHQQQQQRRLSNAFDQFQAQQLKPVHIMSSPQPPSKVVTPGELSLSPLSPMKSMKDYSNHPGSLMQDQMQQQAPAQTDVASPDMNDDDDEDELNQHRFKPFHEEKWSLRYKELLEFHKEHGHAAVPHTYPPNPQLARWVKRQRRQYKLRKDNRQSTMTTERLDLLNSVGFIWDSHDVNWREKLDALQHFRREHGHCNVPSNYRDKKLATWVKCQRRQYKLYWDGKPSAMTPDRIMELEKVGFEWEIRSTVPRNATSGTSNNAVVEPTALTGAAAIVSGSGGQEDFNLLYQTINDL